MIVDSRMFCAVWLAGGSTNAGMDWNGMDWNGMDWNGMDWNGMDYWNGLKGPNFAIILLPVQGAWAATQERGVADDVWQNRINGGILC